MVSYSDINPGSAPYRIVEHLMRSGPLTVAELCRELHVTTTAVRQPVNRLLAEGWLRRGQRNGGPGRPAGVFEVTDKARRYFSSRVGPRLSHWLLQEIEASEGEQKARTILRAVGRRMAEAARPEVGSGPPDERARRLADYLSREGIAAESAPDSQGVSLKVFTCPYAGLADHHREVCEVERSAFSELMDRPVEHEHCLLDGHGACEFHVRSRPLEASDPPAPNRPA